MQTKFDVGEQVKTKDGDYGVIKDIQISEKTEVYSIPINDKTKTFTVDEISKSDKNATKLRKLADLIDKGEIEVLSLEKGYGFRHNKLNNGGTFTNVSVSFIESGD